MALILANLKNANIKLNTSRAVDRSEEEAKTLINKYAIEKLPTLILREKFKDDSLKAALLQAGDIDGDTFVLRQIGGPYVVAATGELKAKPN